MGLSTRVDLRSKFRVGQKLLWNLYIQGGSKKTLFTTKSGPLASVLTINCDAPTEEIPAGVYIAEEFEGLPPAMMDDAIGGWIHDDP